MSQIPIEYEILPHEFGCDDHDFFPNYLYTKPIVGEYIISSKGSVAEIVRISHKCYWEPVGEYYVRQDTSLSSKLVLTIRIVSISK